MRIHFFLVLCLIQALFSSLASAGPTGFDGIWAGKAVVPLGRGGEVCYGNEFPVYFKIVNGLAEAESADERYRFVAPVAADGGLNFRYKKAAHVESGIGGAQAVDIIFKGRLKGDMGGGTFWFGSFCQGKWEVRRSTQTVPLGAAEESMADIKEPYIEILSPETMYEYGKPKFRVYPGDILVIKHIKRCRDRKGVCFEVQSRRTGEWGYTSEALMKQRHRIVYPDRASNTEKNRDESIKDEALPPVKESVEGRRMSNADLSPPPFRDEGSREREIKEPYIEILSADTMYEYGKPKFRVRPGDILVIKHIKRCRDNKGVCFEVQSRRTGEWGYTSEALMKQRHRIIYPEGVRDDEKEPNERLDRARPLPGKEWGQVPGERGIPQDAPRHIPPSADVVTPDARLALSGSPDTALFSAGARHKVSAFVRGWVSYDLICWEERRCSLGLGGYTIFFGLPDDNGYFTMTSTSLGAENLNSRKARVVRDDNGKQRVVDYSFSQPNSLIIFE